MKLIMNLIATAFLALTVGSSGVAYANTTEPLTTPAPAITAEEICVTPAEQLLIFQGQAGTTATIDVTVFPIFAIFTDTAVAVFTDGTVVVMVPVKPDGCIDLTAVPLITTVEDFMTQTGIVLIDETE